MMELSGFCLNIKSFQFLLMIKALCDLKGMRQSLFCFSQYCTLMLLMIFTWIYGLTFILKFCVCVNLCISINLCILLSHVLVHYLKSLTLLLFYGMLNLELRENSFFFLVFFSSFPWLHFLAFLRKYVLCKQSLGFW